VRKPAEAERYKIEMLADAEKLRIERIALGEAEATRQRGEAEAAAEKARGLASAEIIRQQGYAEAESMDKKAAAWQNYNEAALAQLFADKLPDIARAVADPLSKTERMVVISSDGGASKITKDIGQIIADLPPVIESLTGLQLKELLKKVPQLGKVDVSEEKEAPKKVVDRGKITISHKPEEKDEE
jgi:flotillin